MYYQEDKMADNELFYYKSRDIVTKIHTRWVHYEHSIMGTLCHVLDMYFYTTFFKYADLTSFHCSHCIVLKMGFRQNWKKESKVDPDQPAYSSLGLYNASF